MPRGEKPPIAGRRCFPAAAFLYWIQSAKPENTGVYAASFAKPGERMRLLATETNALYAPGGDGKSYLLWLRGGTLVAQEFDTGTLKLEGEPHSVADPVAKIGAHGSDERRGLGRRAAAVQRFQ